MADGQQISLFGDVAPAEPAIAPDFDPETIPTNGNIPIPKGTYADLGTLTRHCESCQRCGLAGGRTHVVVGRGNPQADLVIVGEGPGQMEDETGQPFVGKSGQLLEKILKSVRFDLDRDVYICNVVRCRPPENRTPTRDEIAACLPYLLEQLRLVDPKIILLTGATAVKALIGNKQGITKIRGQWMEWDDRLCMPIFHPAYLLRNQARDKGSPKWLMWQDIQAVRRKYDELRSDV